jgi:hypothetical protein
MSSTSTVPVDGVKRLSKMVLIYFEEIHPYRQVTSGDDYLPCANVADRCSSIMTFTDVKYS